MSSDAYRELLSIAEEEFTCPICLEVPRDLPIPSCQAGHIVCRKCLPKLKDNNCPTCRTRHEGITIFQIMAIFAPF